MKLTEKRAELLLAAVIAVRASSLMFNKFLLSELEVFNILGLRFLIAGALLALLFHKRLLALKRRELLGGAILGALFFGVIGAEMTASRVVDTSTVSLLENCSIVIVPIFEAVLTRRLPDRVTILSILTAFAGVVCLTLHHGSFTAGMLLALLAAVIYAAAILTTSRVSRGDADPLNVGVVQVLTLGLLAMAASFLFETPRLPQSGISWFRILWLACICAGFGFTLQPLAQKHISSAARAGTFCALSPATATLLGVTVLHESLGAIGAVGLVLILLGMVLPHLRLPKKLSSGKGG